MPKLPRTLKEMLSKREQREVKVALYSRYLELCDGLRAARNKPLSKRQLKIIQDFKDRRDTVKGLQEELN